MDKNKLSENELEKVSGGLPEPDGGDKGDRSLPIDTFVVYLPNDEDEKLIHGCMN